MIALACSSKLGLGLREDGFLGSFFSGFLSFCFGCLYIFLGFCLGFMCCARFATALPLWWICLAQSFFLMAQSVLSVCAVLETAPVARLLAVGQGSGFRFGQ
jgi:hypothetical protein